MAMQKRVEKAKMKTMRSMSPAMVAEYKRLMIPKEVLLETFNRYIGMK